MSNFLGWTSLLTTPIWQTILQKQAAFMRIVILLGVVGAIGGTQVHIIAPTVNEETYQ